MERKLRAVRIIKVCLILFFLIGLSVAAYPFVNRAFNNYTENEAVIAFMEKYEPKKALANLTYTESQNSIPEDEMKECAELYQAFTEYNQSLIDSGQNKLRDMLEYVSFPVDISSYGFEDSMIGVISIPALEVELPLYLGASNENLASGAAVLGYSSAPIGGESTNCVIAGHNSWKGTDKFRYLSTLELGDEIQITNPWKTLSYNVIETKIINPDEFNEMLIQEGKDIITLFTCHPYASNGKYRYVVYAQCVIE